MVEGAFKRHGALAPEVLGDGITGEHYGAGLTERELHYFVEHECAASADDVLWRRSKAGLHLDARRRRGWRRRSGDEAARESWIPVRRASCCSISTILSRAAAATAEAYAAVESLQRGGKKVVAVTGRPAGWCDHIARMWPVDAVIGENGAFYFWFADGKLGKRFIEDPQTRARQRAR